MLSKFKACLFKASVRISALKFHYKNHSIDKLKLYLFLFFCISIIFDVNIERCQNVIDNLREKITITEIAIAKDDIYIKINQFIPGESQLPVATEVLKNELEKFKHDLEMFNFEQSRLKFGKILATVDIGILTLTEFVVPKDFLIENILVIQSFGIGGLVLACILGFGS
ncbi:hypothetical protein [Pelosinus fermentans]|uniref:Uncharacterized protein n=1 Tax=Pelosinus fermentans JBW45 TaxID=1192197 RepID=I9DKL5_9FIRM|nr:hypothetical protein [Pelosinus fermentans]AJQ29128.1 hypothetical protein JBW_03791 [Pelosinus fermentans JBW45]